MELTPAVPWNSMELGVRQFRWHERFHGIPWNKECANFADTSSSMEFHGTWSVPISLTREVPWNSIDLVLRQFRWHEQFHGIPWNSMELGVRQFRWHKQLHGIPWNSMKLWVRQFRWHEQFHGIPWNFGCANFVDTNSSTEFHGTWSAPITLTWEVPWNSMEFHGTLGAPISLTRAVPWNSMELKSAPIWLTRAVPWNSMEFHGT